MPSCARIAQVGVCAARCMCTSGTRIGIAADSQQWDIFAGVALLREPIIAPVMTDAERRYTEVLRRIEEEGSLLSDFELKHIKDTKLLAKRAQLEAEGRELSALDEQIGVTAEAQRDDWMKKGETSRKRFAIGDLSKVEENKDTSLRRKLQEKLILVVKQRFSRDDGYSSPWILPQTANRCDENLKETAERCLSNIFEGALHATVSGNAPFSVYSYRYPSGLKRSETNNSVGAKVFFFSALISPFHNFKVNVKEVSDYKWVTADEFSKTIRSKPYRNSVSTLFLR
uniref:Large ribosomal subunit protein mL46 n=1 Tax=Ascaris suum TaxID=6253 RepID=F1KX29_ASCSU